MVGEFSTVGIGVSVGIGVKVGVSVGGIVGVQVGGKTSLGVEDGVKVNIKAGNVVGGSGFKLLCGLVNRIAKSRATRIDPATNIPDRRFKNTPGILILVDR